MTEVVSTAIEPAVVAAVLERGGLVILPTDTVYGLAAHPDHAHLLFEAKGRDRSSPVALLGQSADQLWALAEPSDLARSLAADHWPGPLTLVCARHAEFTADLGGDGRTVGLRCPDNDLVRAIAAQAGPLATTSANPSGKPVATDATAAAAGLTRSVDLIIDGGRLPTAASTVVDVTGPEPIVLRAGPVEIA